MANELPNQYTKTRSQFNLDISRHIHDSNSFNQNLANVVSGLNHEVSPWIGGAQNMLIRLEQKILSQDVIADSDLETLRDKIRRVKTALDHAKNIMATVSKNVKLLRRHNMDNLNIRDTIQSWLNVIFVNDTIRSAVSKQQVIVDYDTVNFEVAHSPMLLSQVFLNLVKNTIDHNEKLLDSIRIRIYGRENHLLCIEDNGVGVSPEMLDMLFTPEITTKNDGDIHGLGLAITREYCNMMGAKIRAERVDPHGLRLVISFTKIVDR